MKRRLAFVLLARRITGEVEGEVRRGEMRFEETISQAQDEARSCRGRVEARDQEHRTLGGRGRGSKRLAQWPSGQSVDVAKIEAKGGVAEDEVGDAVAKDEEVEGAEVANSRVPRSRCGRTSQGIVKQARPPGDYRACCCRGVSRGVEMSRCRGVKQRSRDDEMSRCRDVERVCRRQR